MRTLFSQCCYSTKDATEDLNNAPRLAEEIKKTRIALDVAYAGFNYAVDPDVIDSYIFEINSLLKRYGHLDSLKKQVLDGEPSLP